MLLVISVAAGRAREASPGLRLAVPEVPQRHGPSVLPPQMEKIPTVRYVFDFDEPPRRP